MDIDANEASLQEQVTEDVSEDLKKEEEKVLEEDLGNDIEDDLTLDTAGENRLTIDTTQEDNLVLEHVETNISEGHADETNESEPKPLNIKIEGLENKDDNVKSEGFAGEDTVTMVPETDGAEGEQVTLPVNVSLPEGHTVTADGHGLGLPEGHGAISDDQTVALAQGLPEGVVLSGTQAGTIPEGHAITLAQAQGLSEAHAVAFTEANSVALTEAQSVALAGQVGGTVLSQEGSVPLVQQGNAETITISLEEATQIFLQQQGIQGAVQIAPGTYLQMAGDGSLATSMDQSGNPLQVITTGDGDLVGYSIHPGEEGADQGMVAEVGGQLIRIQKPGIEGEAGTVAPIKEEAADQTSTTDAVTSSQTQVITTPEGQFTVSSSQLMQEGEVVMMHPLDESQLTNSTGQIVAMSDGKLVTVSQAPDGQLTVAGTQFTTPGTVFTNANGQIAVSSDSQVVTSSNGVQYSLLAGTEPRVIQSKMTTPAFRTVSKPVSKPTPKATPKPPPTPRQPDLNSPIAVEDKQEVVINGKKCVLMMNPETKQMCAYPLRPPEGVKRRGRPRKPRPGEPGYVEPEETPTKSLGINVDASSAAEGLLELSNAGPDGIRRSNRARKKAKTLDDYDVLEVSDSDPDEPPDDYEADPEVTITGVKKRKISSLSMPNTPLFLGTKRGRGRPRRYPPPGQSSVNSTIPTAVIIPSQDGQTLMMAPIQGVHNIQALQNQAKSLQKLEVKPADNVESAISVGDGPIDSTSSKLGKDSEAVDSNNSVLDGSQLSTNDVPSETGDDEDSDSLKKEGEEGGDNPATIIQIPENMLNMFVPKKDPIKIGIRASGSDLQRLKCSKCDFQACYPHQYQEHIARHTEDINKCKCCSYLTFDKDDLLQHFKETHPRCICTICDFMADHAYIIKRHMMRHSTQGCTCDICGKSYKDQYILKMHIKMVHMPAEVLFECTVCAKKFTRKAHLKRHLRIHDPEKPFKCPHCDYRGCERSDISKHLLIHQEPQHFCEVCGKAFRHIKNKELHVKRHNGQKDYKCGVCDVYGYTFTDIRKHIERKHADIKTLMCDRCGTAFKSEALLREHQKENCDVLMIEQALAIATSTGGTSQATIQIPSTLSVDGKHITIDGQQIAVDQIAVDGDQVNITVEQVSMQDDEEEGLTLTEDQVVDTGEMTEVDTVVSEDGEVMSQRVIHITGHDQVEALEHATMETEEMIPIAE